MAYEIKIVPRDIMYFRDAKPIGASADGSGALWPLPSTLHSAFMTAFHHSLSECAQEWEGNHHVTDKEKEKKNTSYSFGGLKTVGPFIKLENGDIYLPTPCDLIAGNQEQSVAGTMAPTQITWGNNNLPSPLKYVVASTQKPSKVTPGQWISIDSFFHYLNNDFDKVLTMTASDFYISESRPGIGINPQTGTTENGQFYSAEYLRLKPEVAMVAFAEAEAKKARATSGNDLFAKFFEDSSKSAFIFGGQRGVAWLENQEPTNPFDRLNIPSESKLVKWILLTPAQFNKGWLPGWINSDSGEVLLKEIMPRGNQTREQWRLQMRNSDQIKAKLVAARIGKPQVASGWKIDKNGNGAGGEAKATQLLVPAGSVFYFECDSVEEAKKLKKSLHAQCKSDTLGEQGFGFGLCGSWNLQNI
ncbi:MAG: type III-B CRISPR module-associated Cmr3 family protein [Lentisphaeria bacterium]